MQVYITSGAVGKDELRSANDLCDYEGNFVALIPPFFLDCVVAIGKPSGVAGGPASWTATGFVYGHLLGESGGEKSYRGFLVTNRHVFAGKSEVLLRFNPHGGAPAREFGLHLVDDQGKAIWAGHDDPDIDVAVISINGQLLADEGIRFGLFDNSQHIATRDKAAELGISEGDGVFLLGFPMGLVGQSRNVVVVRQGAIARVRDCIEGTSKDFLIDCSVFPGNSGGPVVTRPEITAIAGTKAQSAAKLIGIVAGYLPYRDVAVSQQTGSPRVIFEENSGLASVFPIDYVEEVVKKLLPVKVETSEQIAVDPDGKASAGTAPQIVGTK